MKVISDADEIISRRATPKKKTSIPINSRGSAQQEQINA